jgi:putative AbiEi antitoxin of type IV toxin-antitoxin system
MAAEGRTRRLDLALTALAARQHGVVAGAQLAELGMGRHAISTRVAAGRLHRLHRGVYAVVAPSLLSVEGRWLAAVLAVGEGAVLGVRSAAALCDLLPATGRAPDVLVARRVKPRPGIHIHCVRSLPEDQVTTRNGIPCTTVARTIVDVAAVLPPQRLERVIGQAEVLRVYDRDEIGAIVAENPRRPGSPMLRTLLGRSDLATSLPRSELEERFLALCDRAGLPRPELNSPIPCPTAARSPSTPSGDPPVWPSSSTAGASLQLERPGSGPPSRRAAHAGRPQAAPIHGGGPDRRQRKRDDRTAPRTDEAGCVIEGVMKR